MKGWIILGIYAVGILLSAIIFPRVFPYQEGDWEIVDGEAYPIDEETHKIHICGMSVVWPLVVVLIPLKLFTMFTDWCYDKFSKKEIMETKFNFQSVPQIWDDYKVLFVFSDDGRVSCRLSFYNETPQEAVISDLYTHESMRNKGGATAILNWCFECAKDRGCNSISLISDNDDWVREWYKRMGFEVESSQVWLKKSI